MNTKLSKNDCRFEICSELGKEELTVYLQWIKDNDLLDSEFSFVTFVMGRSEIIDPRQIFAIWEYLNQDKVNTGLSLQVRRLFMNPSNDISFKDANLAGWFDFIPRVYMFKKDVPCPKVLVPVFEKIGDKSLPEYIFSNRRTQYESFF